MTTKFVRTEKLEQFDRICKEYYASVANGKQKTFKYPSINLPEIYEQVYNQFLMEGMASNADYCKIVALGIYDIAMKSKEDANYDGFDAFQEIVGAIGYNTNLVNQLFAICTTYSLDRLIHGCVREYGNALNYADAVNFCYGVVHAGVKSTYSFNRGKTTTYSYSCMKNELMRETRRLKSFGIPDKKVGDYYRLKRFIKENNIPTWEYENAVRAFFENEDKTNDAIQTFLNMLRLDMDPACTAWDNLNAGEEEFDEDLIADHIDSENADERFVRAVLAVEENYEDLFFILNRMKGLSFYKISDEHAKIARMFAILEEAGNFFDQKDAVKDIKRECAIHGINGALDYIADSSVTLFSEVIVAYNDRNYIVNAKAAPAGSINYRYSRYMSPKPGTPDNTKRAFIRALRRERLYKIADALENS